MLTRDAMLEYHKENPHIFEMFERFAMQVAESGRKNFGSSAIVERIRWYTMVEAKKDTFKINNNMRAFYSRLFEEKHPEYSGFFRRRPSVADGSPLEKAMKGLINSGWTWVCSFCGGQAGYHSTNSGEHLYFCDKHWSEHINQGGNHGRREEGNCCGNPEQNNNDVGHCGRVERTNKVGERSG